MDVRQANELFEMADRLAADAVRLRDALRIEFLSDQLAEVLAEDYDLGDVVRVEQVFGGYVNLSFVVVTRTDDGLQRYFVRKYNRHIEEREIRFEHALVAYLDGKGFHLAARVFPNRIGGTFAMRDELLDGGFVTRCFAVYELLGGEDKYTWVKNRCTPKELESAARLLARFHYSAHDFDPEGYARKQPPIMEFLDALQDTFNYCAAQAKGTKYDECLITRLPGVVEVLQRGTSIASRLEGKPYVPVHCDYHPGNLKWVDEEAIGVFDFDWSKLDYRLFDVALALVYFGASWEGRDDGELRLDVVRTFLDAYQREAARFDVPGAMREDELALLPRMIANANLYVLNWDITAYYEAKHPDDDEYLFYLAHNLSFMDFIEANQDALAALAAEAVDAAGSSDAGTAAEAGDGKRSARRGGRKGPV
jgi:homoserine kinase type II